MQLRLCLDMGVADAFKSAILLLVAVMITFCHFTMHYTCSHFIMCCQHFQPFYYVSPTLSAILLGFTNMLGHFISIGIADTFGHL